LNVPLADCKTSQRYRFLGSGGAMRNDNIRWPTVITKGIINAAMFLANICLAAMMFLVCLNVILRYLFGQPIYWGDEVMIYLMIVMVFLGFGYMLMENRHVRMTAIMECLSVRTQNILWVIISLLGIGYFIFLFSAGIYITADSFQIGFISTITGWPIGPWQVVVCIGLVVLLMASVWFTINRIRIALGTRTEKQKEEISHV
jgi:TRAP-type C4-dicarboxylate transport system permease small subunit